MSELTLFCGQTRVGYIQDAFESDRTWFGMFERAVLPVTGSQARRILDFIDFCVEWNERTKDDPDPPDASEFDAYSDLFTPGLWTITTPGGEVRKLRDAPVFFKGEEVTWAFD
jgi:hypothetical protein